ncbi:hypothetical protein Nepgr_027139 [Nepenthes gracilis]|uniref:Uncharacterized protein n=1 Tax=Nepenthes gracilis TaxID=150966 RepID=A0AAD3TAV7_NEPGR|nr:hypothetical protein Nepgr_027139 [Nepenthes gracilis]
MGLTFQDQGLESLATAIGKHAIKGSNLPIVAKWADADRKWQARRVQIAQSPASKVPNADASQHSLIDGAMLTGYPPPYNKYKNQSPENAGFAPYRLPPIQNQPNPSIIQAHGFQGLRPDPMTSVARHSLAYGMRCVSHSLHPAPVINQSQSLRYFPRVKDCSHLLSISQSKQKIMRSEILNLRPHHWGDQCNHISGFAGSYQFVEASRNAERCARHEKKICEFLMSGSSGKEQEGLDHSHLSNLMSPEAINICMPLQYATRTDFRSENSIMLKPSLFYPSGNRCSQKCLENLVDDFHCHSPVSVNTNGHIVIIDTTADMKNRASILAELYFLKESTQ